MTGLVHKLDILLNYQLVTPQGFVVHQNYKALTRKEQCRNSEIQYHSVKIYAPYFQCKRMFLLILLTTLDSLFHFWALTVGIYSNLGIC